jgi:UDP-N-acetylmuramoyl-L-alanyl-D-glutamate--2,6-diaminopimelate ligase
MRTYQKNLNEMIADLPIASTLMGDGSDITVTGIQFDSRLVKPGDLFVCLTGGNTDGHSYIANAINAGAVAVVGTQEVTRCLYPYIRVADTREALAWLSAALYDHPARKLTVIGVTGTDGKTTTSNMLYQVLKTAGIRAGLISTVNAMIGNDVIDTGFHVTTPEAPDVQRYLALMVEAGLTHVVLETTSHGLAQHRVTGCEYDIAVVTNITHEHLDYHGTYEAYLQAKRRLF